eukprot:scaffold146_cov265-Pinguiococcus_pyrenoidosus.AAC.2
MKSQGAKRARPDWHSSLMAGVENVRCDRCPRDVSFSLSVRCGGDFDLDLCPECFMTLAESEHDDAKRYMVPNALQFEARPGSGWSAREELRLLKAIGTCGLGNWDSIHLLVRSKSAQACEEHFFQRVVPLGPNGHAANGVSRTLRTLGDSDFVFKTGFMPLRGDFDVEYNDGAEASIADMEFSEADSPLELEMKLELLRRYNSKLQERHRWKDFFLDHGSSSYRAISRAPTDVRIIARALRPFSRFASVEEHESLLSDFVTARRLRQRIAELDKYRQLGLSNLRDVELADRAKKRTRKR